MPGSSRAAGPPPLGRRENGLLARRLQAPAPPLRSKAEHFLAFVAIAATLIGYRRLTD
jgi:hypothetical protein